jgi:uncharacterized lipoprotein
MKKVILIAFMLTISGCATTSVYNLNQKDQKGITWQNYNYSKEKVFDACIKLLSNGSMTINNTDKSAGIITTDWIEDRAGIMNNRWRAKFTFLTTAIDSSSSKLKINAKEQYEGLYGKWNHHKITKKDLSELTKPLFKKIKEILKK